MTTETTTASDQRLPVRAVTLFTSGVAYVERDGEVDGDATIPLTFRTTQINDLLKSLVLLDAAQGVRPVTYGARDPVQRTLQAFAIDVTQVQTRVQLLHWLRGSEVALETRESAALSGRVVGVESRQVVVDSRSFAVETVTLLTEAGLESVALDDVRTIRLLDERLDRELREALAVLASGADDQRRQVTLRFEGTGKRRVRVGYITEAPLWKMSYRLVIGRDADDPPYLQGWALVENTTDEDWEDIRLSLVSGRPISFVQDLYQPLYIPRPVVAPDVLASPHPQLHGGAMEQGVAREIELPPSPAAAHKRAVPVRALQDRGFATAASFADVSATEFEGDALRESVEAQAAGEQAGELFQYHITTPVTLPRQQAAMIPVVSDDIEGRKLSVYNADVDARFPLDAVRVTNTTALHLKGGPVTLFDGGAYAGDARMEDVPPGDTRLLSYALDVQIEAERQEAKPQRHETAVRIRRGVLTVEGRVRQETRYTLRSKRDQPRTVLVEHPFASDWTLIAPSAAERTAAVYRFEIVVSPQQSVPLTIVQEKPITSTVALLDAALDTLIFYAGRRETAAKLRQALEKLVARRREIQERTRAAAARENEIKALDHDQQRIRNNMDALEKTTPLYARYVKTLDEQETRIEGMRAEAVCLRAEAIERERTLRADLDALDIGS